MSFKIFFCVSGSYGRPADNKNNLHEQAFWVDEKGKLLHEGIGLAMFTRTTRAILTHVGAWATFIFYEVSISSTGTVRPPYKGG